MRDKKKLLQEISSDLNHTGFCIFREIIEHDAKYDDRLLIQIYCVNKFKWEESERQGKDLKWSGAWELWVGGGGALVFAEVYDEDDTAYRTWLKVNKILTQMG